MCSLAFTGCICWLEWRSSEQPRSERPDRQQIVAIYWHFMGFVWVGLLAVLVLL